MKIEERESIIRHFSDTELQGDFLYRNRLVNVLEEFEPTDLILLEMAGRELERRGYAIEPSVDFIRTNCEPNDEDENDAA